MAEVNGVSVMHPTDIREAAGKSDCDNNELVVSVPEDMTAKDYYFDSYAHFGIHEVCFSLMLFSVIWTTETLCKPF